MRLGIRSSRNRNTNNNISMSSVLLFVSFEVLMMMTTMTTMTTLQVVVAQEQSCLTCSRGEEPFTFDVARPGDEDVIECSEVIEIAATLQAGTLLSSLVRLLVLGRKNLIDFFFFACCC